LAGSIESWRGIDERRIYGGNGRKPLVSMLSIPAELHDPVMALSPP